MFFKNKNQTENLKQLETQIQTLTQAVTAESQRLDSLSQNVSQLLSQTPNISQLLSFDQKISQLLSQTPNSTRLDSLSQDISCLDSSIDQKISQLHSDIQKHDMAIEDLLDEWDEKKSDEAGVRERIQNSEQAESLLLQLFEAYQEQFWNLKHFTAAKDASWAAQTALMEETLEQCRRSCQISLIQECGVKVNYELHDVIDTADTSDPALDKTVADIYRCGYLYKGTVRKKAQVSAYRLTN